MPYVFKTCSRCGSQWGPSLPTEGPDLCGSCAERLAGTYDPLADLRRLGYVVQAPGFVEGAWAAERYSAGVAKERAELVGV